MRHKKNILFAIFGIVVALATVAGVVLPQRGAASFKAEERPYPVKVMTVDAGEFAPYVTYGGFVQGKDHAVVSSKINGRIIAFKKKDGDIVKNGDIVAILSADELSAQVSSARDMIDSLQQTLYDTKKYYSKKINEADEDGASDEAISSAKKLRTLQMQIVQNNLVEAQGNLRIAQSLAKETVVRAPFDGVIVRTLQDVGQLTGPGMPLFEIADHMQKEVDIFVAEKIASHMVVGMDVQMLVENEKKSVSGTIATVGKSAESDGRQVRIVVALNDHTSAQLGQYVTVRIPREYARTNVLTVPASSVLQQYDDTFVYIVQEGRAHKRAVVIGDMEDGAREIVSGIAVGDRVITEGMHTVKDGYLVNVYE